MTQRNSHKIFSIFLTIILALAGFRLLILAYNFTLKNYRLSGHKNEFEKIDFIIKYGYTKEINKKSATGETPLWWACYNDNFELAKYLIKNGAAQSINCADDYGDTPLWWACFRNNLPLVKYLIENGAQKSINKIGDYGVTPVAWACKNNYTELVQYLIENTCPETGQWSAETNFNINNNHDFLPIYSACCNGNLKIVKYLVKSNAINQNNICSNNTSNKFIKANINNNNISENIISKKLIGEKNQLYCQNFDPQQEITKKFFSTLYLASWGNNIELTNFIIFGPDKNFIVQKANDKILLPSLIFATLSKNTQIIKYLIENYFN